MAHQVKMPAAKPEDLPGNYRERTSSHRLSSEPHTCTVVCMPTYTDTHKYEEMLLKHVSKRAKHGSTQPSSQSSRD